MEICKIVSRSIAENQAQKNSTCITLNVCFVFNPSSIAVSTISSRFLKNWEVSRTLARSTFRRDTRLTSLFQLRLLYIPSNDLVRTILKSSYSIPFGYNTLQIAREFTTKISIRLKNNLR